MPNTNTKPQGAQTLTEQYQDRCIAYEQRIAQLEAALRVYVDFEDSGAVAEPVKVANMLAQARAALAGDQS